MPVNFLGLKFMFYGIDKGLKGVFADLDKSFSKLGTTLAGIGGKFADLRDKLEEVSKPSKDVAEDILIFKQQLIGLGVAPEIADKIVESMKNVSGETGAAMEDLIEYFNRTRDSLGDLTDATKFNAEKFADWEKFMKIAGQMSRALNVDIKEVTSTFGELYKQGVINADQLKEFAGHFIHVAKTANLSGKDIEDGLTRAAETIIKVRDKGIDLKKNWSFVSKSIVNSMAVFRKVTTNMEDASELTGVFSEALYNFQADMRRTYSIGADLTKVIQQMGIALGEQGLRMLQSAQTADEFIEGLLNAMVVVKQSGKDTKAFERVLWGLEDVFGDSIHVIWQNAETLQEMMKRVKGEHKSTQELQKVYDDYINTLYKAPPLIKEVAKAKEELFAISWDEYKLKGLAPMWELYNKALGGTYDILNKLSVGPLKGFVSNMAGMMAMGGPLFGFFGGLISKMLSLFIQFRLLGMMTGRTGGILKLVTGIFGKFFGVIGRIVKVFVKIPALFGRVGTSLGNFVKWMGSAVGITGKFGGGITRFLRIGVKFGGWLSLIIGTIWHGVEMFKRFFNIWQSGASIGDKLLATMVSIGQWLLKIINFMTFGLGGKVMKLLGKKIPWFQKNIIDTWDLGTKFADSFKKKTEDTAKSVGKSTESVKDLNASLEETTALSEDLQKLPPAKMREIKEIFEVSIEKSLRDVLNKINANTEMTNELLERMIKEMQKIGERPAQVALSIKPDREGIMKVFEAKSKSTIWRAGGVETLK
jgi:methyl-accepting chemotaxis protein